MKEILVVNVNWLGDVIFSVPIFKALKKQFPQARISCLAVPRVKDILQMIPAIDETIIYDEDWKHQWPWDKGRLVWTLRKRKFDAAFLLHRSLTRALLIYLSGIPVRVGYATKGRGWLLTHQVRPLATPGHRSDYYLNVLESFGIKVEDRLSELTVDEKSAQELNARLAREGISETDFVAVLNPGGNWDLKRWPRDNFTQLVNRLHEKKGIKIIISGAPKDKDVADGLIRPCTVKPLNLTGEMSLKQLVALLKRASVVVSADSGPLHLANAVGTRVLGLFGPTRPEVTGPRGPGKFKILQNDVGCNREPCYDLACPANVCMRSIRVEDVVDEVCSFRS